MNKLFKCTTDNEVFYVLAEDKYDAQTYVIDEYYSHVLDDELSDLMDAEEVTKPGIIAVTDGEETYKDMYDRVRMK